MPDRELGSGEGSLFALLEGSLEVAARHLIDEIERARPDLDIFPLILVAIGRGRPNRHDDGDQRAHKRSDSRFALHRSLPEIRSKDRPGLFD